MECIGGSQNSTWCVFGFRVPLPVPVRHRVPVSAAFWHTGNSYCRLLISCIILLAQSGIPVPRYPAQRVPGTRYLVPVWRCTWYSEPNPVGSIVGPRIIRYPIRTLKKKKSWSVRNLSMKREFVVGVSRRLFDHSTSQCWFSMGSSSLFHVPPFLLRAAHQKNNVLETSMNAK
jgi:hypothetical protein